ncbi:ABC transporter permease [Devosia sp. A16]|uniref:ABC transporter permease n=1 Tax=Devosia sp. A16 TaxID=1736675 RepID=UPI0006D7FC76|nr:ABC transporter permease [Devosia sp. A16]
MRKILRNALTDIVGGYEQRRVWIALATEDIFDQHRRTTLGPLWLLVNYLAFAGTFIFVFNPGAVDPHYAVYVAVGLLVWTYISDNVTQAVNLFQREESFISGTTLPLTVYVMRLSLQNIIRAGYAVLGCAGLLLLMGATPTSAWLWSLVGVLAVLVISPAMIVVFAFLGVFFPDSQFIVSNLMRVAMFATPVFWVHGGEDGLRRALYDWNPFTYLLDVVRQPIVDGTVPVLALSACVIVGLAFWVLAIFLLGTLRRQVALVL